MKQKNLGFGFNGTMLIIYQFVGFFLFTVFNSFAQNIQATGNMAFYGWDSTNVSKVYTVVIILSVLFQLLFSKKIAHSKHVTRLSVIFMIISIACGFAMATVFVNEILWLVLFGLAIFFSHVGSTLLIGILVGQWFPRRKGTVMGLATIAFPLTGGVFLAMFAGKYFATAKAVNGTLMAYLPYLLVAIVGVIIAIIFIRDYPEKVGAYRDNDKSFDMETAKAMMKKDEENKKNSVWHAKNTFKSRDFWFMIIPQGILLATSVGVATQIIPILGYYKDFYANWGSLATAMVTVVACLGSFVLGILDTKFGTKKAVVLACIFGVLTGVIGIFESVPTLLIGFYLLMIFLGAASNFTVSLSAQYWRREDFSSVYGIANPVANVIQAFGPMSVVLISVNLGYHATLGFIGALVFIALILILLFNPENLKKTDAKYRKRAGLSID